MSVMFDRTGRLSMGAKAVLTFAGLAALAAVAFAFSGSQSRPSQVAKDPGVRGCHPGCGAGGPTTGLSSLQSQAFTDGQTNFTSIFSVPAPLNQNVTNGGLGPVFNSNQCSSCHNWPAAGGMTSDDLPGTTATNPLFTVYQADGATNTMPSFETINGPEIIARFPYNYATTPPTPDGSVHQLFTVTGRSDAKGCNLAQPNFSQAQSQNNLVYRQPIETFGDGWIEIIENITITNQAASESKSCASTHICGVASIDPHAGDVNRLGWKAQWRGLITAAAEEMNTELGVTNEYFPNEINQTAGCVFNPVPETGTNFTTGTFDQFTGDPERMALFMSFLAPPTPATFSTGALQGQGLFNTVGCSNCHLVQYTTPALASMGSFFESKKINLYSDLLLHHMGTCLADNIVQGTAQGDMWRTPPLWGAGQRAYFMHDARTSDLKAAIYEHEDGYQTTGCTGVGSYQPSEANGVIAAFNALTQLQQQYILDFIRDL